MYINYLNPKILIRNNIFIEYELHNTQCIHIKNIQFEYPVYVYGLSINADDYQLFQYNMKEDNFITNEFEGNLNFILNFISTFDKNFKLQFTYFGEKIDFPNIIIEYEYISNKLPYFIDIVDKMFVTSNKELCSDFHEECGICIGYIFHINNLKCEHSTITFVFEKNIKFKFDFWDCIFLNNFSNKDEQNKICIFPCTNNLYDILYCIKNNLNCELKECISLIEINNNELRLMNIEEIIDNENNIDNDFDISYLKEIYIDDKKINDGIYIKSMYLYPFE